jgi:hypothetical protein
VNEKENQWKEKEHTWCSGSSSFESGGDNISWESKVLTEVLNASVGQIEVVVLPVESFSGESFGGKGLH